MQTTQAKNLTLEGAIKELQSASGQEECLRRAYDILSAKYQGRRWATLLRFFELFGREPGELWVKNGFLHCTNINKLLKVLLLGSGHFSAADLQTRWTLIWYISPHQYMQVRVDGAFIDIDIWAKAFGVPYGHHAYGFH